MTPIRWFFLPVSCCALVLASCSGSKPTTASAPPPATKADNKPQTLILGKWAPTQPGRENETIEFSKDGKLTASGAPTPGKYKFLDDLTIEYEEPKVLGGQQYTKAKVKVGQDDLTLDIVDAKSRPDDGAEWSISADDMARKGQQEKYKRAP